MVTGAFAVAGPFEAPLNCLSNQVCDDLDAKYRTVLRPMIMPNRPYVRLRTAFLVLACVLAGAAPSNQKETIGWIELVGLTADGFTMEAKVDTGADYSSVHAVKPRYFELNGVRWVEFILHDREGGQHRLRRPVERVARIKKKNGGTLERPVVMLQVCVGNSRRMVQVSLADRENFRYPMLLGRDFLKYHFLVDPSQTFLSNPACK